MSDKIPLSVVVLTKNEESRISDCLESVLWADEIIVIDDHSTDRTVEIAKKYTDKIFIRKMDIEGRHRNWAYAQTRNLWVLSLDADERASPQLKDEIKQTLDSKSHNCSGFAIPRKNYIGRYWVRYGGWYGSPPLKLFRKDKFRLEEVQVHPRAFMEGDCGRLQSDIIHYSYQDLEHFLSKLNRQTTWEALKWYEQNKPMRLGRFIWRTLDRFIRTYIGKRGYKDGFIGFVVAFNAALYQCISYMKYRELSLKKEGKL